MKLFFPIFQRVRDNAVWQWLLFGLLALIAFHKIFSFWFYHGWETSWLGLMGGNFSLISLMKSHGLISYMNNLLFGWRPVGWFATALVFHIVTAMVVNLFVSRKTNRTVGLVAGLLFLITTAHHDVITWGAFESLYAVQTLCFYTGLWAFDIYLTSKRNGWYVVMLIAFFLSLVIRESGLLFLALLFLFDALFYEKIFIKKPKAWLQILAQVIRRHFIVWIIGIGYLILRSSYGGSGHDFIDERVQFRILLFHEHRYFEYIWRGLLAFGYFIGPYVIPYPMLNLIRDIVLRFLPFLFVRTYFFAFVGWILYAIFYYAVYRLRKHRYSIYIWFCFFSFTAVTLFYAFAWTMKDSFLATAYGWSENRWRYLGFTFFAAGLSIFFYNFFTSFSRKQRKFQWAKSPTIGIVLLVTYIAVNTVLLLGIEEQMYRQNSLPAIIFYRTFLKTFPSLTSDDRFFAFKGSHGLNDFIGELSYIYPIYYPNIKKLPPLWVRSEMYYLLKALFQKVAWAPYVHFIDYSVDRGVRDHTQSVREIVSALTPIDLSFTIATGGAVIVDTTNTYPVDFRYNLTVEYEASPSLASSSAILKDDQQVQALSAFSSKLASLLSDVRISVCQTIGDEREPFYDFRKELALDANLSNRSYWWSDCRPAWIVLDMGSQMTFVGAAWASLSQADAVPRDYHYDVSRDGKTWEQVVGVKRNEEKSKIDVFPKPVVGRYLRLWVDETAYRQLLIINEFVPLFPETVSISRYYQHVPELYDDVYMLWDKVAERYFPLLTSQMATSWMKVIWATNPDNTAPMADTTLYIPMFTDSMPHEMRFELLESDYYSAQGQFLKRKLANIRLITPKNVSIRVRRIRLDPFATYRYSEDYLPYSVPPNND
ncbi:hypothetical protein A2973_00735 [Candidatus Gottesmanbacteria bacterium RIFCSPLOWO2_01_FULL_49_10]|uniref:F5/8 type C domain-containing protein n=1 Tax=Candidatus Gottesmanbacteria bacterium RIFCSPLOWO2_01_FULL_49_10 TaxID=1798396 RepID=A0A1F6AX93_9BACT|nr:MAG: hypothetical protein A2973_00735 [Candidatus Gottesmanbacteria bacterium RIFCSPLOWO2_01_FULL_49_10]